ncbi:hypothetical protein [Streptomyces sp. KL116D]|uniref:hypothetical protein n=1 Tax=Streptomyces sp. KL116D TaxID=3045152 RepID=UPI0035585F7E
MDAAVRRYSAARRALIDAEKASYELRGSPLGALSLWLSAASAVAAGGPGLDAMGVAGAGEPTVARARRPRCRASPTCARTA